MASPFKLLALGTVLTKPNPYRTYTILNYIKDRDGVRSSLIEFPHRFADNAACGPREATAEAGVVTLLRGVITARAQSALITASKTPRHRIPRCP